MSSPFESSTTAKSPETCEGEATMGKYIDEYVTSLSPVPPNEHAFMSAADVKSLVKASYCKSADSKRIALKPSSNDAVLEDAKKR